MNDRLKVFREEPGFIKLFKLFKEKYRSLGRVGGTVDITGFSQAEVESIAGFLGQPSDLLLQKGKVSLLSFEQALLLTPFAGYSFLQLLEEVLQESITTKSDEAFMAKEREAEFFQFLRVELPEGGFWWDWIQSNPPDSRWIWTLYHQDSVELKQQLLSVFKAFRQLLSWNTFERLPLFSQRTTGNPHFFDHDQITGKLLLHCMHVDQAVKGLRTDKGMPKTTEAVNELLGQYGLMKDDLWSFITCRGFLAEGDAGLHPVWKAAADMDTVLNVPIKELLKIKKVWPVKGDKVWIVENSSVCSAIMDDVPKAPVICTHGQFRTASWLMFDLLIQSGVSLYYSGDFDPEGLSMAQRLKERYGAQVIPWRMDQESYERVISEEDISGRLSKLDSITAAELAEVASVMKSRKKAGYQEGLVSLLVEDIKAKQGDGSCVSF